MNMEQQFKQFLVNNINKYVEVSDPTNKYQCFDLVVAWTDFLKIPRSFPFLYAYQIYTNYGINQSKYFDRIYNSPDAVAQVGDIIVWSGQYNRGAGHTAICKKADVYTLECFSQNDPRGKPSILKSYNYTNILGWLRPKYLTIQQREAAAIEILKSGDNSQDKEYKLKQLYRVI